MTIQELQELELHQILWVREKSCFVMRVPTGWIYNYLDPRTNSQEVKSRVFVPDNKMEV